MASYNRILSNLEKSREVNEMIAPLIELHSLLIRTDDATGIQGMWDRVTAIIHQLQTMNESKWNESCAYRWNLAQRKMMGIVAPDADLPPLPKNPLQPMLTETYRKEKKDDLPCTAGEREEAIIGTTTYMNKEIHTTENAVNVEVKQENMQDLSLPQNDELLSSFSTRNRKRPAEADDESSAAPSNKTYKTVSLMQEAVALLERETENNVNRESLDALHALLRSAEPEPNPEVDLSSTSTNATTTTSTTLPSLPPGVQAEESK